MSGGAVFVAELQLHRHGRRVAIADHLELVLVRAPVAQVVGTRRCPHGQVKVSLLLRAEDLRRGGRAFEERAPDEVDAVWNRGEHRLETLANRRGLAG